MSTTTITDTPRHELASRINGGIEITLYWDRRDNSTSIDIRLAQTDDTISFRVPPSRALDAFRHPFADLGSQLEPDLESNDLDEWRN